MKTNTLLIILILSICISQQIHATTAFPHPIKFVQPDGDTLTLNMRGDEFVKYAESEEGYTLLYNNKGFFTYAQRNSIGDIEPSAFIARSAATRSAAERSFLQNTPKKLSFSPAQSNAFQQAKTMIRSGGAEKAFPSTGQRKLLCILMEYKDKSFVRSQTEFNNLFNQVGYNLESAAGSVKDYFLECSYGNLNLHVDIVGPYTTPENMAYYGGNDTEGTDLRRKELAKEAAIAANQEVNYADYDNDKDGFVDGIYIIYAGYGEESGGGADCIWAHAWSIWPGITMDGVHVSQYACSPELKGNSGNGITHIGVVCHEFGHTLGAPDYYDINSETGGMYEGTGSWDLQGNGSWNGSGKTPAHPNPRSKIETYQWATATELDGTQEVSLPPSWNNSNAFYKIASQTKDEYFLIENRQKKGFDVDIPGHGMMVYRTAATIGNTSGINATHPQLFYPLAANAPLDIPMAGSANYGAINTSSCPWPGSQEITTLNDQTTPSLKAWNGTPTQKPITGITESATGVISFSFMKSGGPPTEFQVVKTTANSVTLSWKRHNEKEVMLIGSRNPITLSASNQPYTVGQSLPDGSQVLYMGSGTTFTHSGLQPYTDLHYRIFSRVSTTVWSEAVDLTGQTSGGVITQLPYIVNFEAANILPAGFIQQHITGADDWRILKTEANPTSPITAAHAGENYLAFTSKTSNNATTLLLPAMDLSGFQAATLSYFYANPAWSGDQDILKIYYRTSASGQWTSIKTHQEDVASWTKETVSLPEVSNNYEIMFEGTSMYGFGIHIDDIEIAGTSIASFSIHYNLNGGTNPDYCPTSYTVGTSTKLPTPSLTGQTFWGWYTNKELTGTPVTIISTTDSGNKSYWAKWTINRYTVSFNPNGGTPIASLSNVEHNSLIAQPTEPSKDGFSFKGWFKQQSLDSLWNFSTDKVQSDTTLHAKWKAIPSPTVEERSVRKAIVSWALTEDAHLYTLSLYADATKEQLMKVYQFDQHGTPLARAIPAEATFNLQGLTGDKTYYIEVVAKTETGEIVATQSNTIPTFNTVGQTHTVQFDTQGGTAIASDRVESGRKAIPPLDPTKNNATFMGWYKESAYANAWNFATDVVTTNVTIYAKWTLNTALEENKQSVRIFSTGHTIVIDGIAEGASYSIHNITGKATIPTTRATITHISLPLDAGIYVVKVNGQSQKVVVK